MVSRATFSIRPKMDELISVVKQELGDKLSQLLSKGLESSLDNELGEEL